MFKNFVATLTSAACLALLIGCAPSSSDSGASSGSSTSFPELVGKWNSDCSFDGEALYTKSSMEISGPGIATTSLYYSDTACSLEVMKEASTYSDFKGTSSEAGDGAKGYLITARIQTYTLTITNDTYTTAVNSASFCGLTTWVTGSQVDVLGKTCDSNTYPEKNTTLYNSIVGSETSLIIGDYAEGGYPSSPSSPVVFMKE